MMFLRMIYGLGIALLVVSIIEPEAVITGATWWAMGFISLGAVGFKTPNERLPALSEPKVDVSDA